MISFQHREWYSYHFPELAKIVTENYMYARCAKFIGDRGKLSSEDCVEALEEIVMDAARAEAIVAASKSSMGIQITIVDLGRVHANEKARKNTPNPIFLKATFE